jgi:hypothetical protein
VARFGRGSQLQASYTWSRLIANETADGNYGASAPTDLDDPGLDRGLSPLSRKHMFNTSLVLRLPALDGKPGFVRQLLGDWEFSTIVTASSGSPQTIYVGNVSSGGIGEVSGTGYVFNQRPNRVVDEPCRATSGPPEQWLNPAAFSLTGFALGTIGTAGRGICEGPGILQVDAALYKTIPVGKKVRVQVRFEVFNVFNRTQFLNVDTNFSPRSLTLDTPSPASATTITSAVPSVTFGQATGSRDPRQAQLGIKLLF